MEAFCHNCTSSIDTHIIEILRNGLDTNDMSLVAVQKRAGLSDKQLRANIKLVISGGRNEPQDAIAGIIWAVLQNTSTLEDLKTGNWAIYKYLKSSPDGYRQSNRDEDHFDCPDKFNPCRDTSRATTLGAGPHFCAGAWAAKSLIINVAVPMIFETLPFMQLNGEVEFSGSAFRGPISVPVVW